VASSLPPPAGFLLRTGQRLRYELPAVAFIAAGIGLMFAAGRPLPFLLGLALVNFVLMCVWARCPRCRCAVVWRVFTTTAVWTWMTAVLSLRQCPACGFDGAVSGSATSGGATNVR
jgi:hypothetical protein